MRLFLMVWACFCSFVFSGCSVFMAMHGKPDPNLSVLTIGQDRAVIVQALGKPASSQVSSDGRIDSYKLQKGNAPSKGRALANAGMDLLTFGFWELAATPGEAMSAQVYEIKIEYDKKDKFVRVLDQKLENRSLN